MDSQPILDWMRANSGTSLRELAAHRGVHVDTVSKHVRWLAETGEVYVVLHRSRESRWYARGQRSESDAYVERVLAWRKARDLQVMREAKRRWWRKHRGRDVAVAN